MLHFVMKAHQGIKGFVVNEKGEGLSGASIKIKGNDKLVTTSKEGEYWKLLVPGNYSMVQVNNNWQVLYEVFLQVAFAEGYSSSTPFNFSITSKHAGARYDKQTFQCNTSEVYYKFTN